MCLLQLSDASKNGVAQETLQNAVRKAGKVMTEQEARKILGVTEQSTWEEILQVYFLFYECFLFIIFILFLLSIFIIDPWSWLWKIWEGRPCTLLSFTGLIRVVCRFIFSPYYLIFLRMICHWSFQDKLAKRSSFLSNSLRHFGMISKIPSRLWRDLA